MAMTPEQKAASKKARSDRDKAYWARKKARNQAEKTGLDEIERRFGPAIEAAKAAEMKVDEWRNREIDRRKRVIAELESELKEFSARSMEESRAAHRPVTEAYDAKRAAEKKLEEDLDRLFPDLVGSARWSAANWGKNRNKALPLSSVE
ncbi:hypothetical protein DYI24_00990 [Rhodopseudomonas sp. BR0C11]|uniref:hypothetical protein n=1 Tax=Rhodopseudomonas sp. BR0C11 TaxID=2269370 RepID=UPI0013DEBA12|nr:hypothetical protein [Rhodopseudomonas sp. BR0C11]NEV75634.1 hypothetical protein [Rhodopseudomonas sp. BR0C11]